MLGTFECVTPADSAVDDVDVGRPIMPSVYKIQLLLESAWQKGFDPAGCAQLQATVVGTRKWIGATDITAFLSSFHVR